MTQLDRGTSFREKVMSGLFWSWNLIFLAFLLLGFAPRMLPELVFSVQTGLTPLIFLLDGILLSLIPVAAVALGLTVLRHSPARQFALGYVVEGPLMLLLVIRFFVIRQATPGFTALLAVAVLGMAGFLWQLFDKGDRAGVATPRRVQWLRLARLVGLTLMMLTSLYAALWIAFYAVPALWEILKWLGDTLLHPLRFLRDLGLFIRDIFGVRLLWIPFTLLGFILALYTASLVLLAPLAIPWLSVRAWRRAFRRQARAQGWFSPGAAVLLAVLLSAALFAAANRQPQQRAFALLADPPGSVEQARALLEKQDEIRAGLLNAYLAPFRYISAVGEVVHVSQMYRDSFKLPAQSARQVQAAYELVARPLLYEPVAGQAAGERADNLAQRQESAQAARLYQDFFDTPIIEGEREEIVSAVTSTWSSQQAEAAWQAADDREVRLARQEITIQEHGEWAEVELYEVYENRTQQNQEVIYYFNLPESAVLTGLWLGNSPDRVERFAFQVAPRGAAQTVYREETRRNIDPALLEQIGPRQYRLRAFPVLPMQVTWNLDRTRRLSQGTAPLYLWMTYRTLAVDGAWPLPRLAFKNNVFWDARTERLLNGGPLELPGEAWLPESAPVSAPVEPAAHRVDFPGGMSVVVQPAEQVFLPGLPPSARLALVVDRSRSMAGRAAEVDVAIARLKSAAPDTDVYLTASAFRGEGPELVSMRSLEPGTLFYFGGQNPAELLAQFDRLSAGQAYDAVLVLTDGSAYELGESLLDIAIPGAPVWMVHLGGDIPLGYNDTTLEVIQASGGGVAGSLDEALARLAPGLAAGAAPGDVLDGYTWTVLPSAEAAGLAPEAALHTTGDGLTALLARRWVLAEMRRQRGTIGELETLDRLHALAEEYGIVTPYSSMIVLVNERQQDALDRLEQKADRFEREVEGLTNTTPLVGVPEPHEWLLMGLAGLFLAWYASRRRLAGA
jgi:putative PEP-CTERM system integral membrane protein